MFSVISQCSMAKTKKSLYVPLKIAFATFRVFFWFFIGKQRKPPEAKQCCSSVMMVDRLASFAKDGRSCLRAPRLWLTRPPFWVVVVVKPPRGREEGKNSLTVTVVVSPPASSLRPFCSSVSLSLHTPRRPPPPSLGRGYLGDEILAAAALPAGFLLRG